MRKQMVSAFQPLDKRDLIPFQGSMWLFVAWTMHGGRRGDTGDEMTRRERRGPRCELGHTHTHTHTHTLREAYSIHRRTVPLYRVSTCKRGRRGGREEEKRGGGEELTKRPMYIKIPEDYMARQEKWKLPFMIFSEEQRERMYNVENGMVG